MKLSPNCFISPEKLAQLNARLESLSQMWRSSTIEYGALNLAEAAIKQECCETVVSQAREHSKVVLSALLIAVGERGLKFPRFSQLLAIKDEEPFVTQSKLADTHENRRILHSIISSLLEISSSWSYGTYRLFLEGKKVPDLKEKPQGYGIFKGSDSWTEAGIIELAKFFTDPDSEYYEFFRQQVAPTEEELELPPAIIKTADYRITPVAKAMIRQDEGDQKNFDREFIKSLADDLEKRGLAPIEKPKSKKIERKLLTDGSTIDRKTIKDLAEGDIVRVRLKCKRDQNSPESTLLYDLVIEENQGAKFVFSWCDRAAKIKFRESERCEIVSQKLIGATYIGRFEGNEANEIPERFKYIISL